jgi:hypothetical protein
VTVAKETEISIELLDREEGFALLDQQARELLGMSAEEFVRAWDEGKLAEEAERRLEIMHLAMLLPFAR